MASTFGILRRKSWFQLRGLRWASFGIGLLVPFFLWAGAIAAVRGWLPFPLKSYSVAVLFGEASPAVIGLLWSVFALVFASQAFAGDRGDGTDRFLLERPVSPRKIWFSKLTSAALSWLVVAIGHSLFLLALALVSSDAGWSEPAKALLGILGFAAALSVVTLLAGAAAGEMLRSSMQAFTVGIAIVCLPFLFAYVTMSAFPLGFYRDIHLGMVMSVPLFLALPLASWVAGCRGEPAGRGRAKRGGAVLVLAFLLSSVGFAVATPLALRHGHHGVRLSSPDASANRAFIIGGHQFSNSAWAIEGAERVRYFPPPVERAAWEPGGERFAVLTASKSFGRIGKYRIETGTRDEVLSRIELDSGFSSVFLSMQWFDGKLLLWEFRELREGRIYWVDPRRGEVLGTIDVFGPQQSISLHLDPANGRVLIHRMVDESTRTHELRALDLEALEIGSELLLTEVDLPISSVQGLSPSGRHWFSSLREEQDADRIAYVTNLETGERVALPGAYSVAWLTGDRLVFLSRDEGVETLTLWHPDGGFKIIQSSAGRMQVAPSPDREKLLVAERFPKAETKAHPLFRVRDQIYYDAETDYAVGHWQDGERRDLTALIRSFPGEKFFFGWAGPSQLTSTLWGDGISVAEPLPDALWERVAK